MGLAPAYRGMAYVIFERLPLRSFGNRVPQLSFEIFRSVDGLETRIKAVTIIPSAGEFVYAQDEIYRSTGLAGGTIVENVHRARASTGPPPSISSKKCCRRRGRLCCLSAGSAMICAAANARSAHGWVASKTTSPVTWSAGGLERASATVVSSYLGAPAFGGTPSDASVVGAIQDLKVRGFSVMVAPFL